MILEEKKWSGRKDLNLRPPGPEPGALARLRYAPTIKPSHKKFTLERLLPQHDMTGTF
jgi:hypothetical protein